jgi:predicted MFS family arabinose efflux permease
MSAQAIGGAAGRQATLYAWLVLALLTGAYTLNWMDRYVVVILIEPIRRSLHLSDTALGVLTGFSYSLVYSVMGIPIGRLADRRSRRRVLSLAMAGWSACTALTGLARGFPGLAAAHAGVAVCEAGCSPPAYSLISDYFPARRRGTAIAVYSLGISFGIWLALTLGGWLNERVGWRMVFALFGLPGLLYAAIFHACVREPRRDGLAGAGAAPGWGEALRYMAGCRAFLAAMLGLGLFSFAGSGFEMWTPAYLIRSLHLDTAEVGRISGLVEGVAGIVGTLLAGVLADRLGGRNPRWYLWLPLLGAVLTVPCEWLFLVPPGGGVPGYGWYFLAIVGTAAYTAPMMAVGQSLLPPRMRALGAAVMLFVLNIVGAGGGSFAVGLLSDLLAAAHGADALRLAMLYACLSVALGALCATYAAVRLPGDLVQTQRSVENV